MADLASARVVFCPMPGCDWKHISVPGPGEQDGALAEVFGWGVFAATARAQRLEQTELAIREHLESHPADKWALALAAANDRIAALERQKEAGDHAGRVAGQL